MLSMSKQLQLRAQKADNGVALADFGHLALKLRRLFSDERAQCQELVLTVQRRCFHAPKHSRFAVKAPTF